MSDHTPPQPPPRTRPCVECAWKTPHLHVVWAFLFTASGKPPAGTFSGTLSILELQLRAGSRANATCVHLQPVPCANRNLRDSRSPSSAHGKGTHPATVSSRVCAGFRADTLLWTGPFDSGRLPVHQRAHAPTLTHRYTQIPRHHRTTRWCR